MAVELRGEDRFRRGVRLKDVRAWCKIAFEHIGAPEHSPLTVVLTGDEEIRKLNREFRGADEPTDVLSFENSDPVPVPEVECIAPYLGDIVISIPRARQQALEEGHPLIDEVRLLVVHGVLHLAGRDHATDGDQAEMWAEQDAILSAIRDQEAIP